VSENCSLVTKLHVWGNISVQHTVVSHLILPVLRILLLTFLVLETFFLASLFAYCWRK